MPAPSSAAIANARSSANVPTARTAPTSAPAAATARNSATRANSTPAALRARSARRLRPRAEWTASASVRRLRLHAPARQPARNTARRRLLPVIATARQNVLPRPQCSRPISRAVPRNLKICAAKSAKPSNARAKISAHPQNSRRINNGKIFHIRKVNVSRADFHSPYFFVVSFMGDLGGFGRFREDSGDLLALNFANTEYPARFAKRARRFSQFSQIRCALRFAAPLYSASHLQIQLGLLYGLCKTRISSPLPIPPPKSKCFLQHLCALSPLARILFFRPPRKKIPQLKISPQRLDCRPLPHIL